MPYHSDPPTKEDKLRILNMSEKDLLLKKADLERDMKAMPFANDPHIDRWKLIDDELKMRATNSKP